MNMIYTFLDNKIELHNDYVNSIEVQNKNYFFRLTNLIYKYANGDEIEELYFTENDKELKLENKIRIITGFYNFDFNNRKYINELIKVISSNQDENLINKLNSNYNKFYKSLENLISDIDLNFKVNINDEFSLNEILKNFNLSIQSNDRLIDNLLLLIDVEKQFNINKILVFINLKQYLNKEELIEFEKYCIYNNIYVILFDNIEYKKLKKYEMKILIDKDLNEVVC